MSKILKREDIHEEIKLINGTNSYYISDMGNVYSEKKKGHFLKMSPSINHRGYNHISIIDKNGNEITRRINRLVAIHFIPNPNNLPIVGHKNNIKTDNKVENLYWTTYKENTRKAIQDGLMEQASGYEDSQSKPVIVYDIAMNEIDRVGSICLCSKKYHISKSTITRHCTGQIKGKTRCGYYFRYDNIK